MARTKKLPPPPFETQSGILSFLKTWHNWNRVKANASEEKMSFWSPASKSMPVYPKFGPTDDFKMPRMSEQDLNYLRNPLMTNSDLPQEFHMGLQQITSRSNAFLHECKLSGVDCNTQNMVFMSWFVHWRVNMSFWKVKRKFWKFAFSM